jgi:molybdenum-dependent DNA-binding transcriptional regulator ModE
VFPKAELQASIRIDLESGGELAQGKSLLEAIRETGSITAAALVM